MLPRVKIYFENGNIGAQNPSEDGVCGLICTAVGVVDKFELLTPELLTSLDGLTELGITSSQDDANAILYKTVSEFYKEAPANSKLWIYGVADTVTLTQMLDVSSTHAKALINAANGSLRMLMVSKADADEYTPVVTDGIDADVTTAITKAQELCEWATNVMFAPLFCVIPGRHFSGTAAALADLTEGADNRVAVLIGDTVSGSDDAAVGLLCGRYAAIQVHRSAARVRSGAIAVDALYIGSVMPESAQADVINDLGYITFRSFVGKAGYYFTDDKLATSLSDDYALIPRRRSIDKAYRIAYQTLVDELGNEIPLTTEGFIPMSVVKSIQNSVERAIMSSMGVAGELGSDPDDTSDTGVECYINPEQNIVSTSKFEVRLRIKPFGYAKYIDLYIGFKTTNA